MASPITKAFASPLKGVSQQNPRDRVDGQCDEQINLIADPVRSLTRRAPVQFLNVLRDTNNNITDNYFEYNNKEFLLSTSSNYAQLLCITDGRSYNYSGSIPAYVSKDMQVAATATDILLLNPTVVTEQTSEISTFQNKQFVITCKGGVVNNIYGIKINIDSSEYVKTYKPTSEELATADNVTGRLFEAFNGDTGFKAFFDITLVYDCILFSLKDKNKTYKASITDGYGGKFLIYAEDAVKEAASLPRFAPDGFNLKVEQLPDSRVSVYYMRFVITGTDKSFGRAGNWVESVAPNIANKFNTLTMPHKLTIDEQDGTFSITQAAWFERRTGDAKTNPTPSFVGSPIEAIAVIQGRICLTSKSIFMTRSKEPLDCYRNSATVLVDSDPIDVENTVSIGNKLTAIIQYNRNIAFYAQGKQFLADANKALTPANFAAPVSSSFSYDGVTPVTTGVSVIHSYKKGDYTSLMEIFPRTNENDTPFANITEQVEQYIEGNCRKIVSNLAFDTVFVLAGNKRNIYVYKYLYTQQEKALSAWSLFTFAFDIDNVFSSEDKLYIVYSSGGKTYFGIMELDYPEDTFCGFTIYLDNKVTVQVTDGVAALPFVPKLTGYLCVMRYIIRDGENIACGLPEDIDRIEGSTVYLKDSTINGSAVIGLPTTWSFIPSRPFLRDREGNIIDTGKLNIIKYLASVVDTASFNVAIRDKEGREEVYGVSTNLAGNTLFKYSTINLANTTLNLPFQRESARYNIRLFGSGHEPFTLVDLAYTGKWFTTSRS